MKSKKIGLMLCALCTTLLTYSEYAAVSSAPLRADAGAPNRAKASAFAEQAKIPENKELSEVYNTLSKNHARMAVIDNEIAAAGDGPYDMTEYKKLEQSNKEQQMALRVHLRKNMQVTNWPTRVDEPKAEEPKAEAPKVDAPNALPRPEMRNMPERLEVPKIRRTPADR